LNVDDNMHFPYINKTRIIYSTKLQKDIKWCLKGIHGYFRISNNIESVSLWYHIWY
jgi:hypothetical protein